MCHVLQRRSTTPQQTIMNKPIALPPQEVTFLPAGEITFRALLTAVRLSASSSRRAATGGYTFFSAFCVKINHTKNVFELCVVSYQPLVQKPTCNKNSSRGGGGEGGERVERPRAGFEARNYSSLLKCVESKSRREAFDLSPETPAPPPNGEGKKRTLGVRGLSVFFTVCPPA